MDDQERASALFWATWKLAPIVGAGFGLLFGLTVSDPARARWRALWATLLVTMGGAIVMGLLIDHWYPPSSFAAGFFLPVFELPLAVVVGLVIATVCRSIARRRTQ